MIELLIIIVTCKFDLSGKNATLSFSGPPVKICESMYVTMWEDRRYIGQLMKEGLLSSLFLYMTWQDRTGQDMPIKNDILTFTGFEVCIEFLYKYLLLLLRKEDKKEK